MIDDLPEFPCFVKPKTPRIGGGGSFRATLVQETIIAKDRFSSGRAMESAFPGDIALEDTQGYLETYYVTAHVFMTQYEVCESPDEKGLPSQ